MGGADQPYMYSPEPHQNGSRFSGSTFDPKAVTRASWEPKPRAVPRQNGPYLSFNRHPDAHMVLSHRSQDYSEFSPRMTACIKWIRRLQLFFRLLELNGAIGLLVLFVLIDNIDAAMGWIMRITPGIVALSCVYAIYHLARDPAGRPPASQAAYQLFAGLSDLATLGLYGYGAYSVNQKAAHWTTRLSKEGLIDVFVPAVYYTLIGSGGLHLLSLLASLSLASMFRKISLMPPDMNPLESHLTARPKKHQRNKSSMSTLTMTESEKRLSTPLESHRHSGLPYESLSRPPSIPFMHTRTQSRDSTSTRQSHSDLPSRQYQIVPGNAPQTYAQTSSPKRASVSRFSLRGTYSEVPLDDKEGSQGGYDSQNREQRRPAKFTEAWVPSESMISRTQKRNRNQAAAEARSRPQSSYTALSQRYNVEDSDDSENEDNIMTGSHVDFNISSDLHPNPLRSNPSAAAATAQKSTQSRTQTPFRPRSTHNSPGGNALAPISPNERRAGTAGVPRSEMSSAPDLGFYSRPYGELKSATPPIMIGGDRKTSSGNDYGSKYTASSYGRRNVSGRLAEEGLVGK